jgi:hypothetical protein
LGRPEPVGSHHAGRRGGAARRGGRPCHQLGGLKPADSEGVQLKTKMYMQPSKSETWELRVEQSQPWGGLGRAAEAAASLNDNQAALRGA